MNGIVKWILIFVLVFTFCVLAGTLSEVTYWRKPPREVIVGFRSILITSLIMAAVFVAASIVYGLAGWRTNP
jgi:hypothetical protein